LGVTNLASASGEQLGSRALSRLRARLERHAGRQIQVMFDNRSSSIEYVQTSKLRALAITTPPIYKAIEATLTQSPVAAHRRNLLQILLTFGLGLHPISQNHCGTPLHPS